MVLLKSSVGVVMSAGMVLKFPEKPMRLTHETGLVLCIFSFRSLWLKMI